MCYTSVVQLRAILQNLSLVNCKRRKSSITSHGRNRNNRRPIPSEDLFFLENTVILRQNRNTRLSPTSSNNFKEWPARVKKLDHSVLYHSYTLNVTLTAKIKMSLWNTNINNYRALFNKMSDVYNHYNFNLVMQL